MEIRCWKRRERRVKEGKEVEEGWKRKGRDLGRGWERRKGWE
jgi:hypothetical protein